VGLAQWDDVLKRRLVLQKRNKEYRTRNNKQEREEKE
jgi:hypothetical protein